MVHNALRARAITRHSSHSFTGECYYERFEAVQVLDRFTVLDLNASKPEEMQKNSLSSSVADLCIFKTTRGSRMHGASLECHSLPFTRQKLTSGAPLAETAWLSSAPSDEDGLRERIYRLAHRSIS